MFHRTDKRNDPLKDRRFTLSETLRLCEQLTKVRFDLDVCGEALAHVCDRYYDLTRGENGLTMFWSGHVWCNPPWSQLGDWIRKAWQEWDVSPPSPRRVQTISMLIPTRTEQSFWHKFVEPYRDRPGGALRTFFLPGRQQFGNPDDPRGENAGSPPFNCVLLHWS